MLQLIIITIVVLISGFLMYYLLKKTFKVAMFVLCIGMAYVALKYFLGVI